MQATMATRIRQARWMALLTQVQLANAVGVNRSAVAQWERESAGTHPSVANLSAIATATRVSFEWLATGRGEPGQVIPGMAHAALGHTNDALEARCLQAVRLLPKQKREPVCDFLEQFAR